MLKIISSRISIICISLIVSYFISDVYENILGFIFVSPNFGINHKLASLITWPLSEYWLSLIIGKTTESKARNDLNAKYWTLAYPTDALIPMAKLVKKIKTLMN